MNGSGLHKLARPAAVAGSFYPSDSAQLQETVLHLVGENERNCASTLKGVIAPHAGYPFSGAVAASAFSPWKTQAERIQRVVLLGPSHFHPFDGMALSRFDYFSTPLGVVPVDTKATEELRRMPLIKTEEKAHVREHCLEVELPFLQLLLKDFRIVPLVVGDVDPETVRRVVVHLWGGEETRFVVSSDLSHFLDNGTAHKVDEMTATNILAGHSEAVGPEQACGWLPIQGFVPVALERKLRIENVDLRNSADAGGPPDRVVGYGAFWFYEG